MARNNDKFIRHCLKAIIIPLTLSFLYFASCGIPDPSPSFYKFPVTFSQDAYTRGVNGRSENEDMFTSSGEPRFSAVTDIAVSEQGWVFALDRFRFSIAAMHYSEFDSAGERNPYAIGSVRPTAHHCQSRKRFDDYANNFIKSSDHDSAIIAGRSIVATADYGIVVFGDSLEYQNNSNVYDLSKCAPIVDYRLRLIHHAEDGKSVEKDRFDNPISAISSQREFIDPDRARSSLNVLGTGSRVHLAGIGNRFFLFAQGSLWSRKQDGDAKSRVRRVVSSSFNTLAIYDVDSGKIEKQAEIKVDESLFISAITMAPSAMGPSAMGSSAMGSSDSNIERSQDIYAFGTRSSDDSSILSIIRYSVSAGGELTDDTSNSFPFNAEISYKGNKIEDTLSNSYTWNNVVDISVNFDEDGVPFIYLLDGSYSMIVIIRPVDVGDGKSEYRVCGKIDSEGISLYRPLSMVHKEINDRNYLFVADNGNYRVIRYDVTDIKSKLSQCG